MTSSGCGIRQDVNAILILVLEEVRTYHLTSSQYQSDEVVLVFPLAGKDLKETERGRTRRQRKTVRG